MLFWKHYISGMLQTYYKVCGLILPVQPWVATLERAQKSKKIRKNLLHFAPRQHIFQLEARAAFKEAIGSLPAPENSVVQKIPR